MTKPIFIALDFPDQRTALNFLAKFPKNTELYVKVGMELFYKEGPEIIRALQRLNVHIFLDLKLHDIPNTVKNAARSIGSLGVEFTTAHALGGLEMLTAAKEGLLLGNQASASTPTKLLAISQLTSTDQLMLNDELQILGSVQDSVQHLTEVAIAAGVDGMVSSALEVPALRPIAPDNFLFVTPGIRPLTASSDDQTRIVTPSKAQELQSSALVVGRPITAATDPVQAYQAIKQEWEQN